MKLLEKTIQRIFTVLRQNKGQMLTRNLQRGCGGQIPSHYFRITIDLLEERKVVEIFKDPNNNNKKSIRLSCE